MCKYGGELMSPYDNIYASARQIPEKQVATYGQVALASLDSMRLGEYALI